MSDCQSLSERPDSLNRPNYTTHSSPHHRRNSRIRNIACLLLTSFSLITFVSILVIGITHNSTHRGIKPNSTSLNSSSEDKINISVYYEVYSLESRDLIVNQLVPLENKYVKYINIKYVPFGRVVISKEIKGNYQYRCDSEQLECQSARLHACLQQQFSNYTDQSILTSIIACSISQYSTPAITFDTFTKITKECVKTYTPDGESAQSKAMCSNAEWLINRNHDMATALRPQLKFMPTVIVNGIHLNQDQMRQKMDTFICGAIKEQTEVNC